MIVSLTSAFIQNNLLCPDGQRRIEYVDRGGTGLYVEVRSTSPGQGSYLSALQGRQRQDLSSEDRPHHRDGTR